MDRRIRPYIFIVILLFTWSCKSKEVAITEVTESSSSSSADWASKLTTIDDLRQSSTLKIDSIVCLFYEQDTCMNLKNSGNCHTQKSDRVKAKAIIYGLAKGDSCERKTSKNEDYSFAEINHWSFNDSTNVEEEVEYGKISKSKAIGLSIIISICAALFFFPWYRKK